MKFGPCWDPSMCAENHTISILFRKSGRILISCLTLLLLPGPEWSAEPVQVLDFKDSVEVPVEAMEYFLDDGAELQYPGVRNQDFRSRAGMNAGFGLNRGAVWIRFTVEAGPEGGQRLIQFAHPLYDELDVFLSDGMQFSTGRARPPENRPVMDSTYVIPVELEPDSRLEVYARARSGNSIKFPVTVWKPEAFFEQTAGRRLIIGFYYGGIFLIFLYNVLLFFSLKERVYIAYSGYLLSILFFIASESGMVNLAGLQNLPYLSERSVPLGMFLSLIFLGFFVLEYMAPGKYAPRLRKVHLVFLSLFVLLLPFSFIPSYMYAVMAGMLLVVGYVPVLFATAILGTRVGFRPARIFLISWSGMLVGVLIFAGTVPGWLPTNHFTRLAIPLGLTFQVVLLSLGLADRIRELNLDLQKEREELSSKGQSLKTALSDARNTATQLEQLAQSQNALVDQLSDMSSDQASASEEVAASLEGLTGVTESIHRSMEDQSRAGQEMRSRVDQLRKAHEDVIQKSSLSRTSVEEMQREFIRVSSSLDDLKNRISDIEAGGKAIAGLVKVIGDISEQVNMLALNASIEAARAGDYGRGFAVVADEVGKLAGQTGSRSREISASVTTIQRSIQEGSRSAEDTSESVRKLAQDIERVKESLSQMLESVRQQNAAVDTLDDHTLELNRRSSEIAVETANQLASVKEGQTTVQRISEMATDLNAANQKLGSISEQLSARAEDLSARMQSTGN